MVENERNRTAFFIMCVNERRLHTPSHVRQFSNGGEERVVKLTIITTAHRLVAYLNGVPNGGRT